MSVIQLLENLIASGIHFDEDSEEKWRIVIFNLIGIVAIFILIVMGTYALVKGKLVLGLIDNLVGGLLILSMIFLRRGARYAAVVFPSIYLTAGLFLYLFVSGGFEHTGHLWLYVFPLVAIFLLGFKAGSIANLVLVLPVLVYALFFQHLLGGARYSASFSTRFFPSLLTVVTFSLIFEYLRQRYYQGLARNNHKLQTTVFELEQAKGSLKQVTAELKQRVRELQKANQAKGHFLANMSHELRTPLNHIIGFTELVVDQNFGPLNDAQEDYLKDSLSSSRHLLSLINDILDLSKIDAGKLVLNISEIDLPALLKNSLVMIREKALKNAIVLETDLDGIPETIQADERKLKQILYNLLSNAAKFTPEGGRICLKACLCRGGSMPETDETLQISITDTGVGIATADLQRIFDPFEQAESSASRRFPGTGLGLSLSRQLVELHGGRIWAQSEGQNRGTVFAFTLPLGFYEAPSKKSGGG